MFFQPEDVSIEISKDLILWPYFIASEISRISNSIFSSNLSSIILELELFGEAQNDSKSSSIINSGLNFSLLDST